MTGRRVPCDELAYSHPSFEQSRRVVPGDLDSPRRAERRAQDSSTTADGVWSIRDEDADGAGRLASKMVSIGSKWQVFEN